MLQSKTVLIIGFVLFLFAISGGGYAIWKGAPEMPATTTTGGLIYSKELEPQEPLTYDEATGIYRCVRRWHVHMRYEAAISVDIGAHSFLSPGKPPNPMYITHTDGITEVNLYPVARLCKWWGNSKQGQAQTEMQLTYQGRVSASCIIDGGSGFNGVVNSYWEPASKTELLVYSYDTDPVSGGRLAIGANSEGVNVIAGTARLVIVQNISWLDTEANIDAIRGLVGTVNLAGWLRPDIQPGWAVPEPAGAWMYLPPQIIKNQGDGTCTIKHYFDYDAVHFHKHIWFFSKPKLIDVDGNPQWQKQTIGAVRVSTVALPGDFSILFDPCFDGTTTFAATTTAAP